MKVMIVAISIIVIGCSSKQTTSLKVKKVNVSAGLRGEKAEAQKSEPLSSKGMMPNDSIHKGLKGHGMMGIMGGKIESDNGNPPLKKTGMGSAQEMNTEIAKLKNLDQKDKETLEKAFRMLFTIARDKRDIKQAKTLFDMVLKKHPENPIAHRSLAYIAILNNFQVAQAISEYKLAVKADPTYREAYYGIASLYLTSNPQTGYPYFQKAMSMGAKDEHGLKSMYEKAMKGAAQ